MGGNLFAGRGLPTPRFSADIYQRATQLVVQCLQPYFKAVEAPICAPEKPDHGDIDVSTGGFVAANRPTPEEIGASLGAIDLFEAEGNNSWHYAIPWTNEVASTAPTLYIQVDVNLRESVDDMRWELFKQNHGDFCPILGSMIRRHYLTISGDGLYLCIPELLAYQYAKKKSRVLLSSEPSRVLEFLLLDESQYCAKFETIECMFRYLATCRFYRPYQEHNNDLDLASNGAETSNEVKQSKQEEDLYCTSRDRQKARTRTVFAKWHSEFLPEHADDIPAGADAYVSHEVLKEIVFSFFGEQVRSRYECARKAGFEEIARNHFWGKLRPEIPAQGTELGDAIAGLRVDLTHAEHGTPEIAEVRARFCDGDFTFAKQWCLENWQDARDRYRGRMARTREASGNLEPRKTDSWSTKVVEVYSREDDARIMEMKAQGRAWTEILAAIGKTSRSQLVAHWKQNLQTRISSDAEDG